MRLLLLLLLAASLAAVAADPAPTPKQALTALLAAGDIPLSVHSSCKGVGSSPTDRTLRDYVAGLLENFSDEKARNSVQVKITPAKLAGGKAGWQCDIVFGHMGGEDPFRYGVSFVLTPARTVVRSTLRCTGSG